MAWTKMTTAQLNTLNAGTLGAVTVGQLLAIADLLARVRCKDADTLTNVVTALGNNNP